MKKKNKVKDEKKKETKFKTKWKTWMTVVVSIASVFVISGATVLGVYLAGGFDEKNIQPESIEFSFDENLYNSHNRQLEVGEDFQLTITSPTEDVTRRKIELSFENGVLTDYDPVNELISNRSIQVPKYVSLGRPFNVHLLSKHLEDENGNAIKDDSGNYINWIAGGISKLIARSQNIQIGTADITIAIDVPVYSTETLIYNSKGELTTQVVRNESFTVETKYIPTDSRYMYSDNKSEIDESQWREKHSYYEAINTDNIKAVYDDKHSLHFVASNQAVENIKIDGYTFATAKAQIDYDALVGDIDNFEYYYTGVLSHLSDNADISKSSFAEVSIGEENIGYFTVSKVSQTISMNVEAPLNLYLNQYPYQSNSDYLGVRVYSSSGLLLDNLLKNIVISFDNNGVDPTLGENKSLIIEGDDKLAYVEIDGKRYYKPNSNVNDLRYSNWKLTATEAMELKINVALLVNDDTQLFADANGQAIISQVNLSISKHEEKPVSWLDQSDLNVLLNYKVIGEESKIESVSIDLNQYASVPEQNIYKDKVFFVWFGDGLLTDYIDMANNIIGENGYILERSGRYQTSAGRVTTLFAVNGSFLTLYNTGEFSLYFATVKLNSADGLYDIVEMSSSAKNVISKTALYSNSVQDYDVDASNFVNNDEDQEISINLGSDLDFKLRFTIAPESVPVFRDEFQKGFVKPVIYDIAGNDISEYFTYNEGTILTDTETKVVSVEYRVTTKASVQLDSERGLYLGYISLIYENDNNEVIEWKEAINVISEKLINIYKPTAEKIEVENKSDVYNAIADQNAEAITVDQNLTTAGGFNTSITVKLLNGSNKTFDNVTEFINDIVGANGLNFVITDQKGKTNTLQNQWKFVVKDGNASIINILPNGQSFTFRNTNSNDYISLSLIIKSNDENSTLIANEKPFEIKLNIKSTGISNIRYDSSINTYQTNLNVVSDDTSKEVIVKKYGAVYDKNNENGNNEFIDLKSLIKLYINNEGKDEEFSLTNVNFRFTPQYYAPNRMNDKQIIDLFGENGMLTLYGNNDQIITFRENTADEIRKELPNLIISKIKINKNFASAHSLEFSMVDSSGAVNIMFTLQLLQNLTVTNNSYLNENAIWASENKKLENKVKLLNTSVDNFLDFNHIFKNEKYYIVSDEEGKLVIISNNEKPAGAIGEYNQTNNTIKFYDFWHVDKQIFTVYFRPEGNNSFALNHAIQFEIKRDLVISQGRTNIFYVLGGNPKEIGNYVQVLRHDGSSISGVEFNYQFSEYIKYENGEVLKKDNADFFFDYNQKSLPLTLTIKSGNVELGQMDLQVQLMSNENIYSQLASSFTLDSNSEELKYLQPKSQIINNGKEDINYLMFARNAGPNWNVGKLGDYFVIPSHKDRFGNNLSTMYQVNNGDSISFRSRVEQQLLFGLNDPSSYIVLNITDAIDESGKTLASLHIPMLVSNIGYDFVVYENQNNDNGYYDSRRTEIALLEPEQLLKMGIYNEIEAGKLTQILSQYDFDNRMMDNDIGDSKAYQFINKAGLYTISGFEQSLNVKIINDESVVDYSSLINSKLVSKKDLGDNQQESYGYVTLNHLDSTVNNAYVAFEYVIDYYGRTQTFYYLLKVKADVEVVESTYAYDGVSEYITGDSGSVSQINLEELFDEKTLHNDKKRFYVNKLINLTDEGSETLDCNLLLNLNTDAKLMFSYKDKEIVKDYIYEEENKNISVNLNDYFTGEYAITKQDSQVKVAIMKGDLSISYRGEKLFNSLKYKNEIVSVVAGDNIMTDSEMWKNTIELYFSKDFSTLYYRPFGKYANSKMTITVKHTYQTTEEQNLSVIGGEQIYTLILNEDSEIYAVRFTDNDNNVSETDQLKLTINNGKNYGEGEQNVYSMQVDLLKKEAGNISTIIRDKLNVGISEGKEFLSDKGIVYNKSTGQLDIYLKNYIDSDKKISLAVYTQMGFLASINIDLKANLSFSSVLDIFNGGTSINLKNVISLTEGEGDDKTVINDYNIKNVVISGSGKDLVKRDGDMLIIGDLISDKKIVLDYTISYQKDNTSENNEGDLTEEREFKFSHEYTLKQNIVPKNNIIIGDETIAGTDHSFSINDLFSFENGQSDFNGSTYEIICTSSNPAFNSIEMDINEKGKFNIITNQVSDKVTLTLTLKVKLKFLNASQEYEVTYSFVVAPSVKLDSTYPVPNSNGMMNFEYIDSGVEFEDIKTFLNSKAVFGEKNRIKVLLGELKTAEGSNNLFTVYENESIIDSEDLTVILNNKTSNAEIYVDNSTEGIAINSQIDENKSIKFARTNDSGDAIIELSISYNKVNVIYNIKILKNSLAIVPHTVSNFTMQGDYPNNQNEPVSVSYEKIFVDKTNTNDLFVGGRLVNVSLNSQMSDFADEYYFVFSDTIGTVEKYYASYPIYISANDQGGNRYYDLGISFAGKTFKGLYLASSIEESKIGISDSRELLKKSNDIDVSISEQDLPRNLASSVFKLVGGKPQVEIANRAQMTYGVDENGNEILVDFDKYDSIFNINEGGNKDYLSLTNLNNSSLNKITRKEFSNLTFNKNDGSKGEKSVSKFTFNYYYMAGFDIEVKEKVSNLKNLVEVEVSNTYESLNNLLGIHHPTTNRQVTASDFTSENSGLGFELIYFNSDTIIEENIKTILNGYLDRYNITSFKRTVKDGMSLSANEDDYEYMFVGPTLNASNKIYDYELIPFGAKNDGDYVLGKITYKVGSFETYFYSVIKIMPDYEVSYGKSSENGKNEIVDGKTIKSNFDFVDKIEILKSNDSAEYKEFILTGDDGFMTIKHKNGTGERKDLSTSSFNITIPVNVNIEGVTYNNSDNLQNKIFYQDSLSGWNVERNETQQITKVEYNQKSSITFDKAKAVIFGNQYYFIEGTDVYGYTYRLYFMLKATEDTPKITNTFTIMEGDYIDLAVNYVDLTIKNSKDNSNEYVINSSETKTPRENDVKVKLLNFDGIKAWQFVENYTVPQVNDNDKIYLDKYNDVVNIDQAYIPHKEPKNPSTNPEEEEYEYEIMFNSEAEKYLNYPMIDKITVDNIQLYDPKTNTVIDKVDKNIKSDSNISADETLWSFATEGSGYFGNEPVEETDSNETDVSTAFKHRSPRGVYGKDKTEGKEDEYVEDLYVMPKLTKTELYQDGDSANLRLVVRLKYQDNKNNITEYCDCPVDIIVVRKADIEQKEDRVVRDGVEFALKDKFSGKISDNKEEIEITGFINDTIEVLVKANNTASFDMTLERDGKEIASTRMSLSNTSSNINITKYESISGALGVYVKKGDIIKISNVKDAVGIYYISSVEQTDENGLKNIKVNVDQPTGQVWAEGEGNVVFNINAIDKDIVYVENASLLNNFSYSIKKYYIAQCQFNAVVSEDTILEDGDNDLVEPAKTYDYRVTADYEVTGYVYKLERNYDGEIGFTIQSTKVGDTWTSAPFDKWASYSEGEKEGALKLYLGNTPGGGKINIDNTNDIAGEFGIDGKNLKNYLSFRLDNKGGDVALGNANIDSETGEITLNSNFKPNQYIRVEILMKVSGIDRNIATSDSDSKVILGKINISTVVRAI